MSEYVLRIPDNEAPEAKALLRYLNELGFVYLIPQPAPEEPTLIRPTEDQRRLAVHDMLDFLANRPSIDYTTDEVAAAVSAMRSNSVQND